MKKVLIAIIIALLTLTIGATFVGCDKQYEQVNVIDAYSEVMDKILKHKSIDIDSAMGGEITYKLFAKESKSTEKLIDLHVKMTGNIDMTPTASNRDNNFVIELINNKNSAEKLLGIYSEGENLYLDSANSHYKIENFRINDLLKGAKTKHVSAVNNMSSIVAGIFFDKAEVNGGTYVFHYNIGNVLNSFKAIMQDRGQFDNSDMFAKVLQFKDWNDMFSQLSQINGRLEYHFTADKLTSKNWYNESKTHEFSMRAEGLRVVNGKYTINFDELLSGKEWIETKLLNITAQGELYLKSAGTTHAKYNWEFHSNLDMFELIANGGDFNMDEDDMAHFVIYNKLENNSKEFNDTRINAKTGVIFELAYDPKQLGTKNVLMAINLKALLPKSLSKELNLPGVALNMIPDYYGMYIDNDIIKEMIIGQNDSDNSFTKTATKAMVDMLRNGIDLSAGSIDANSDASKMLNIIAAVNNDKIDNIDFKINKFIFADMANKEYKLSEHFLGVANEETAERKDFGETLGFIPAKESTPITKDGKVVISLSDGTVVLGGSSLTEQEINKMIGGSIEYTFIGLDNQVYKCVAPVKIIAISGLDKSKVNELQTINLITSPPDGKNLIGFLTAIDAIPSIPTNVYSFDVIIAK